MRIASDKKSLSSRLVHSICVRVNPAFESSNQEAESYNEQTYFRNVCFLHDYLGNTLSPQ